MPNRTNHPGRRKHDYGAITRYIEEYTSANGYAPSFREIGVELKMSTSNVQHALSALAIDGKVKYAPGLARTVRVIGPAE